MMTNRILVLNVPREPAGTKIMAVTTRLIVAPDGTLSTADPLPAGEYIVSDLIEMTASGQHGPIDWSTFPTLSLVPRDPNATYSREEIYGDEMR